MITIKTRLHTGICASCGGGRVSTHYEWTTGPLNLLKAIEQLKRHRRDMVNSYGNIGCGGSWLEIDGTAISPYAIMDVTGVDDAWHVNAVSRTKRAKALIAQVRSGAYARAIERKEAAAIIAEREEAAT